MSLQNRLSWLQNQLDRDDLTDAEFDLYNPEANTIQVQINEMRAKQIALREQRQKDKEEELILERMNSLTEEIVDKMYEDTCLKYQDVNGISFKKWYEQSLKYYSIDTHFVVHSKARSPNTVDSVPCLNLAHAKYRILILIRTKFRDHTQREYDFAWNIDDNVCPILRGKDEKEKD